MVVAHDRAHQVHAVEPDHQVGPRPRVGADALLLDGIERPRLEQDAVGHRDLAEVVQVAAEAEGPEHVVVEPQRLAHRHRVAREAIAVPQRVGIPRLDGERQGGDHRFRPLQLPQQHLHPQQGRQPRAQLDELHRLGEEIVGPRREPRHPRLQVGHRGEDDHRHQLVARIGLEPRAELDAVHGAQVHVGEHQIRAHHVQGVEGLLGGDRHEQPVAESAQQARQHLADVGVVLDHQDGGPVGPEREIEASTHR